MTKKVVDGIKILGEGNLERVLPYRLINLVKQQLKRSSRPEERQR